MTTVRKGLVAVERIVQERRVDGHRVAIVETVADEGAGFVLVIDEVLVNEIEPLGHIPSDEEIREVLRSRRPG